MVALGGDGEHAGRDGEAFTDWDDTRRRAAAGDPAARRPAGLRSRGRRLGAARRARPWSSRHGLKRPMARLGLLVALDVRLLHDAPPSSTTRVYRRSMSSTAKKTARATPPSPPWIPPRPSGVKIM